MVVVCAMISSPELKRGATIETAYIRATAKQMYGNVWYAYSIISMSTVHCVIILTDHTKYHTVSLNHENIQKDAQDKKKQKT